MMPRRRRFRFAPVLLVIAAGLCAAPTARAEEAASKPEAATNPLMSVLKLLEKSADSAQAERNEALVAKEKAGLDEEAKSKADKDFANATIKLSKARQDVDVLSAVIASTPVPDGAKHLQQTLRDLTKKAEVKLNESREKVAELGKKAATETPPAPADVAAANADVERAQAALFDLRVATSVVASIASAQAQTSGPLRRTTTESDRAELRNGRLQWGVIASLVQLSVRRDPAELARARDYTPRLEFVPSSIGFQFIYSPSGTPWRLPRTDKGYVQVMGAGGFLLANVDSSAERGALSLGGTLTFFNNLLGVGLGFDLYRGIPVRGGDGVKGSATVPTGAFAWALSRKGEVTPENVFMVWTLGVDRLVTALSGQVKE